MMSPEVIGSWALMSVTIRVCIGGRIGCALCADLSKSESYAACDAHQGARSSASKSIVSANTSSVLSRLNRYSGRTYASRAFPDAACYITTHGDAQPSLASRMSSLVYVQIRACTRIYAFMLECQDEAHDCRPSSRVLLLLGDSPGSTAREPVLRPASSLLRAAHNAVFDPRQAKERRAPVDDQSPCRADRDGPNHTWAEYSASAARGSYRRHSKNCRSTEQGAFPN